VTAHDLIVDIFSRVQGGVPSNMRRITGRQLNLLRTLIGEDKESRAAESGGPGVTIWTPPGRDKYVITEDLRGKHHSLTRLANIGNSGTGMLF
jgi:hypothetical protein